MGLCVSQCLAVEGGGLVEVTTLTQPHSYL